MAKYVFSLGLIPVQEFIVEARRSRDLRTGSAILSWLMSRVLLQLTADSETQLIIPHPNSLDRFQKKSFDKILDDEEYSLPNRASGYCGEVASKIFDSLQKDCLENEWEELYKKTFASNRMREIEMDPDSEKIIRESFVHLGKLKCPIQLIWVLKEVPEPQSDSPTHLELIQNLYSDIKRTRPIQIWQGKKTAKCDQCGKREMISPTADFREWWDWQGKLKSKDWVVSGRRIDSNERLCIVCLTKRFAAYLSKEPFPSTSRIAAQIWRSKLLAIQELTSLLEPLENALDQAEVDDPADIFYRRSLNRILRKPAVQQNQDLKNQIREFRDRLRETLKDKSLEIKNEPSNYLAVLTFDGDSMGKKIQEHAEKLPELLYEFSKKVIERFKFNKPPYAKIFYVGGDEGLILVPIETALETALEIKSLFDAHIQGITTLSMGMTIFDRNRPLGGAIELAHQALQMSKQQEGKRAFTITIQTASGNVFSSSAHWGDAWERVRNAVRLINGEIERRKLSMGWCYEVEKVLQSLPDKWGVPEFCAAVAHEVKRITRRKLFVDGKNRQEKEDRFGETWKDLLKGENWFDTYLAGQGKQFIANQLHAIAFLARESAYKTEHITEQIEGEDQ